MKQGAEGGTPAKCGVQIAPNITAPLLISGPDVLGHAAAPLFLRGDDSWGTEQMEMNLASKNKTIQSHAPLKVSDPEFVS